MRILLTVSLAFVIGVFILLVHRKSYAGILYSKNSGIAFVLLTMVVATVLMPAISDVKIAIGMFGTFSLIRFRSAVKDQSDIVYMIWAVAAGIFLGAKFFLPALAGSLAIGIILLLYNSMKSSNGPVSFLSLQYNEGAAPEVNGLIKQLKNASIKNKKSLANQVEITLEVPLNESNQKIVDRIMEIPYVSNAAFLSNVKETVD